MELLIFAKLKKDVIPNIKNSPSEIKAKDLINLSVERIRE